MNKATQKTVFKVAKYAVLLLSFLYLTYKLSQIEHWKELLDSFRNMGIEQSIYISIAMILMPINWYTEVAKWRFILSKTHKISTATATKAVLAGLVSGYITPNRIGEFAGRISYLPPHKMVSGTILSIVNGVTQNLTIAILGVCGGIYYYSHYQHNYTDHNNYWIWIAIFIIISLLTYFFIPYIIREKKLDKNEGKWQKMIVEMGRFSGYDLLKILSISIVRYAIFTTQFYLMLLFFQIEIEPLVGYSAISLMYLFVTITPSFAASEAIVRGSYAIFVLGVFTDNEICIFLTSLSIWLINFLIPMLIGGYFLSKKDSL